MKLHIRSFCITAVILTVLPGLGLFIWCSLTGFGFEVVRLFESIHPSGGLSILPGAGDAVASKVPGIVVNTLYLAVDAFIASVLFSSIYNFFVDLFEK